MVRRALALVALGTTAHAGGLERPNGMSARGTGMGGAFTAWADDATAVYYNPGALDAIDPHVLIGGELVVGPRSYTPVGGDAQQATVVAPLPVIGVVGRFSDDDHRSRLTFGAGVWNTFGGKVSFPVTGQPALDSTEDAVVEADAGASLRISDRLSIGGALRLGYGLFSIDATQLPFNAHLSASGLGLSAAWGALIRPTETIRIGVAYRQTLRVSTSGDGTVEVVPGNPAASPVDHDQLWPQQASLGVGWQPAPHWKLAAQLDWTAWSQVHQLVVHFPTGAEPDQVYSEDWNDNWTARLGAEYALSPALAVRAGTYLDTAAVPDRTLERQYLDSNKLGLAAGASIATAGWRFDGAVDVVVPSTRTVPDNAGAFPADVNKAPGDYRGTLITFELAAARSF